MILWLLLRFAWREGWSPNVSPCKRLVGMFPNSGPQTSAKTKVFKFRFWRNLTETVVPDVSWRFLTQPDALVVLKYAWRIFSFSPMDNYFLQVRMVILYVRGRRKYCWQNITDTGASISIFALLVTYVYTLSLSRTVASSLLYALPRIIRGHSQVSITGIG